ncbi:hypothetical protein EON65_35100 [archaeon]|nr:MAG: hypothetical protein EON65_35100 [archaeon]
MNVSRLLRNVGSFLFNYRNRIVIASIIAILVAILISYYDTWNPLKLFQHHSNERRRRVIGSESSLTARDKAIVGQVPSPGNRSRLLLRIRRQFDISCRHFLPTLRKKIIDTVDLNGTVKQIKELRQTGSPGSADLERALWEEIKVASFTLMFMSTYTTVALCTVLKLQLHILARSILQTEQVDLRVGSVEDEMNLDNQVCGTSGHLQHVATTLA